MENLDRMEPESIARLDSETLSRLDHELGVEIATLKARRSALDAGLSLRYAPSPTPGTGWITDGNKAVRIEVGKLVDWDQAKLREAQKMIESWGEPVEDYLTIKLSVAESAFKAWPKAIQKVFEPARTVKPGKPKISFHEPKAEAA